MRRARRSRRRGAGPGQITQASSVVTQNTRTLSRRRSVHLRGDDAVHHLHGSHDVALRLLRRRRAVVRHVRRQREQLADCSYLLERLHEYGEAGVPHPAAVERAARYVNEPSFAPAARGHEARLTARGAHGEAVGLSPEREACLPLRRRCTVVVAYCVLTFLHALTLSQECRRRH